MKHTSSPTQYKSIIEYAEARGSSASTKPGARRYLLDHLPRKHPGLARIGTGQDCLTYNPCQMLSYRRPGNGFEGADPRLSPREAWKRYEWRRRVEQRPNAICHALGYQLRHEITADAVARGDYSEEYLVPIHLQYRASAGTWIEAVKTGHSTQWPGYTTRRYTLSTLPRKLQDWRDPDCYLSIAGRIIILQQREYVTWDNDRGSHRGSQWPSSKTITRTAVLLRADWDDLSAQALLTRPDIYVNRQSPTSDLIRINGERKINFEARGNWLLKIIADLLNIQPAPVRGLKHIQLDPHYGIAAIRTIGPVIIYRRTLAGEIIDYCAAKGRDAYHGDSPRAAVRGLAAKLAAPGSRREIIDMPYALSLGFCRTGVEQFASDNGLDPNQPYTRSQIAAAAQTHREANLDTYGRELAKAGINL